MTFWWGKNWQFYTYVPLNIICADVKEFGSLFITRFRVRVAMGAPPLSAHILLPANKVWGKAIFSRVCVNHSVHSGGFSVWCRFLPGPIFLGGSLCLWSHVPSRGSLCRGLCLRGSLSGRPPSPRTETPVQWRAGGTHPTGMLFCFVEFSCSFCE